MATAPSSPRAACSPTTRSTPTWSSSGKRSTLGSTSRLRSSTRCTTRSDQRSDHTERPPHPGGLFAWIDGSLSTTYLPLARPRPPQQWVEVRDGPAANSGGRRGVAHSHHRWRVRGRLGFRHEAVPRLYALVAIDRHHRRDAGQRRPPLPRLAHAAARDGLHGMDRHWSDRSVHGGRPLSRRVLQQRTRRGGSAHHERNRSHKAVEHRLRRSTAIFSDDGRACFRGPFLLVQSPARKVRTGQWAGWTMRWWSCAPGSGGCAWWRTTSA